MTSLSGAAYIERAYNMRKTQDRQSPKNFPFWDYRSRRGSMSTNSSGSSDASSLGSGVHAAPRSEFGSDSGSDLDYSLQQHKKAIPETSNTFNSNAKISILFTCKEGQLENLINLHKPMLDAVNADNSLMEYVEIHNGSPFQKKETTNFELTVPSLAATVFILEDEDESSEVDTITEAIKMFADKPWCYHHTENISGKLHVYMNNKPDYYSTKPDLPLWGIRQVHCGKQLIRFTRFASQSNWNDTISFYENILGRTVEVEKTDFCLFNIYSYPTYDLQFALKRVPEAFGIKHTDAAILQIKTADVSNLANIRSDYIQQVSDFVWEVSDYDGNLMHVITHDLPRTTDRLTARKALSPLQATETFYV